MVVEVLAREGMYCCVRTHYRYEGWTPARCLLEDGALAAQWQSVPKLVVQKPYIDVLNEPKVQGGCLQSKMCIRDRYGALYLAVAGPAHGGRYGAREGKVVR